MRRTLLIFLNTFLLITSGAQADTEVRGRVFYEKLSADTPSFFFHSTDTLKDGKRLVVTVYTDKEGKELAREENTLEDGKLLRSFYKQSQVNEQGEVELKDGKARFTFTDADGTETDSEDIVPNMILGSMINEHLFTNWDALMKGESVRVRYLAIERCETIGFKFFKDVEHVVAGKPVVDILMKPSSFIIAAIVDPIRFTITKDLPHRLVTVVGRTPIRWPKNQPPQNRKDWKAIDARIEIDAPKVIPPPPHLAPPPLAPAVPGKKSGA